MYNMYICACVYNMVGRDFGIARLSVRSFVVVGTVPSTTLSPQTGLGSLSMPCLGSLAREGTLQSWLPWEPVKPAWLVQLSLKYYLIYAKIRIAICLTLCCLVRKYSACPVQIVCIKQFVNGSNPQMDTSINTPCSRQISSHALTSHHEIYMYTDLFGVRNFLSCMLMVEKGLRSNTCLCWLVKN